MEKASGMVRIRRILNVVQTTVLKVFYDGRCSFCRRSMERFLRRDARHRLVAIDIHGPEFPAAKPKVGDGAWDEALHVLTAEGTLLAGAEAVRRIWLAVGPNVLERFAIFLMTLPGGMAVAGVVYWQVAKNRHFFGGRCKVPN